MNREKNNLALKAGMWYIICNFLLKGLAFITTPIFTRLLSTEDYGITAAFSSYQSIFTIIATLDLYSCIQISKQDFGKDNDKFVSSVLSLSSAVVIAMYLLIRCIKHFVPSFLDMSALMIDLMFLGIFFSNAFTLMQTQHRAYLRYKQVTFFTITSSVLSVILAMLFVVKMNDNKYMGRIIGNLIPSIIISMYAVISIYSKGRCVFRKDYWKYALIISVPLIPHHLAGNILSNFDRIMINKFCGSSDVALYSIAYNCAMVTQLVWSSFNGAWTPWFFDMMTDNDTETIKKAVKPYLIAFSVIILAVIAAAPEIIRILGPEEYWDSKWVVPPAVLGIYCQFVYSLYVNIEFYYKKTKIIALGTMIAAGVNIVLNAIFIPILGYIAAAYTTLAGYAVLVILHYCIARRYEKRDLYSKAFVIKALAGVTGLTASFMFLYERMVVRYALIAFVAITVSIVYGKDIYGIVRRRRNK